MRNYTIRQIVIEKINGSYAIMVRDDDKTIGLTGMHLYTDLNDVLEFVRESFSMSNEQLHKKVKDYMKGKNNG